MSKCFRTQAHSLLIKSGFHFSSLIETEKAGMDISGVTVVTKVIKFGLHLLHDQFLVGSVCSSGYTEQCYDREQYKLTTHQCMHAWNGYILIL